MNFAPVIAALLLLPPQLLRFQKVLCAFSIKIPSDFCRETNSGQINCKPNSHLATVQVRCTVPSAGRADTHLEVWAQSNALLLKAIQRGIQEQRNPGGFVDKQRTNYPNISLHQKWALYAAEHTLSQKKHQLKFMQVTWIWLCGNENSVIWHKKLGLWLFSCLS